MNTVNRLGGLITQLGSASLYRGEHYNGNTTSRIAWSVVCDERVVRECLSRREAKLWLEMYSTNQQIKR